MRDMHKFQQGLVRFLTVVGLMFCSAFILAQDPPDLSLANTYQRGLNLNDYWVSEKYDGVRAYWSGKQLLARSGNPIQAPSEFIQQLPRIAVDGELWFGRGQFGRSAALIQRAPDHPDYLPEWQAVTYMVFDAPQQLGNFKQRLAVLHALALEGTQIEIVKQWSVESHKQLQQQLETFTQAGAEGLMLRSINAPYRGQRSNDLVKVKQWQDAEADVKAWLPGKGKYQGMMGALLVVLDDGREIKIGTGFNDTERAQPPALGSRITFKYQGQTSSGLPRFPVYWRERLAE